MNKTELIDKVAKESALSKAAAEQVVNSVFSAIAEAMKTGDKVTLVGFGTFPSPSELPVKDAIRNRGRRSTSPPKRWSSSRRDQRLTRL